MKKLFLTTLCLITLNLAAFAQTGDDNAKDDYDKDESERTAEDELTWKDKLVAGGAIFPGYSNGWYLEFTPFVGYRITNSTIFGVGLNYSYRSYKNLYLYPYISVNKTYGGRAFVMKDLFFDFFGQMEIDYNFQKVFDKDPYDKSIVQQYNYESPGFLLGLGYRQGDERFSYNLTMMYDVLFDINTSARNSPWVLRGGVMFAL